MLNRLDLRGVARADLAARAAAARSVAGDEPVAAVRAILDDVAGPGRRRGARAHRALRRGDQRPTCGCRPAELADALATRPTRRCARPSRRRRDSIEAFHRSQLRGDHTTSATASSCAGRPVPVDRAGLLRAGRSGLLPVLGAHDRGAGPGGRGGRGRAVRAARPRHRPGGAASTLAAAALAGVDEVYAVGGAQAIAAMAYGTESIRPVDVIAGPGNVYVALAKREVAGRRRRPVGVRRPVGDRRGRRRPTPPPRFAAIDVIVQAEHGPDGLAWLITWSPEVADAIDAEIDRLVAEAPRRGRDRAQLRPGWAPAPWSTDPRRRWRWPTSSPPSTCSS